MRSAKEAMAAAEASRTGHTVVTTIHSNSAAATYKRMMTMVRMHHSIDEDILMEIMVEAYPVVVFTKQLDDGSRKVMGILEGLEFRNRQLKSQPLYRFETEKMMDDHGNVQKVIGQHRRVGQISENLQRRMLENGISAEELAAFTKPKNKEVPLCSGSTP